ncbi:GNAT family N-acetyltransferase [soil metagenome]
MIEVVTYNPVWPEVFESEAIKITEALGNNCIAIHHIGSTSVPGLSAKPIIDIMPIVLNIKTVDLNNFNMQQLGYDVKGEYGFMLRRFFVKENAFHVHVFEQNNPEIERHLKFRDWMRRHLDDRNAYAALKKNLAKKFSNDRTAYCFGKDEFVATIDEKAGWHGIRIVKAFTEKEWDTIKAFRKKYFFDKLQIPDPYTHTFNDPNHVHIVVCQKVDIIGYAHIQFCSDDKAVIRFILIDENKRNQNFGSQLLIFIEKWLKSRECKGIYSEPSPETLQFYKQYGFIDMPYDEDNSYQSTSRNTLIGKLL